MVASTAAFSYFSKPNNIFLLFADFDKIITQMISFKGFFFIYIYMLYLISVHF